MSFFIVGKSTKLALLMSFAVELCGGFELLDCGFSHGLLEISKTCDH